MAAHNKLGKEGEEEAVQLLMEKGYTILHRNWRAGKKELDIVAQCKGLLVVVEVKTRRDTLYGLPEDAVSEQKIRRIVSSTDTYLKKFGIDLPVRFDIITVTGGEQSRKIMHIEDAFYPPVW